MRQDVSEEQKAKPNLEHRVKDTVKIVEDEIRFRSHLCTL